MGCIDFTTQTSNLDFIRILMSIQIMKGRLENQRSEQIKLTNGTMTNQEEIPF